MQYRQFGNLDFLASALGFGCMRLPTLEDPSKVDEPEAIRMIRHAIDEGVNYLDTAYVYHGGHSEEVLGSALLDGYRRKVKVATKLPPHLVKGRADFERILGEQLSRLQTDHIDFYLVHGIGRKSWEGVRDLGVMKMEPPLGGRLAALPKRVESLWDRAAVRRTSAEWALQWVWAQPEVSVVLSGMSSMEQLRQNLESAEGSRVGSFSAQDLQLIAKARELCLKLNPVPCTQCRYCMPCPNGVQIPNVMLAFNRGIALDGIAVSRGGYPWLGQGKGEACIQCRVCEERCPQGIPIGDWMPYIDEVLGQGADHDPARAPSPRRAS